MEWGIYYMRNKGEESWEMGEGKFGGCTKPVISEETMSQL